MSDKAELERRLLEASDEWHRAEAAWLESNDSGQMERWVDSDRSVMHAALALADAIRDEQRENDHVSPHSS